MSDSSMPDLFKRRTEKKRPIPTMPEGIWESSRPIQEKQEAETVCTETTDLQGNGYPLHRPKSKDDNRR